MRVGSVLGTVQGADWEQEQFSRQKSLQFWGLYCHPFTTSALAVLSRASGRCGTNSPT